MITEVRTIALRTCGLLIKDVWTIAGGRTCGLMIKEVWTND